MKLYTKEMFLIAAEKCEVSMIDAKHIMQYIDEYVKPIQLPTQNDLDEILHNSLDEHAYGYIRAIEHLEEQIKINNKGGSK